MASNVDYDNEENDSILLIFFFSNIWIGKKLQFDTLNLILNRIDHFSIKFYDISIKERLDTIKKNEGMPQSV